jgi:hypothetical protein
MLKELRLKSKDGLPMWFPFIDVDMLSLEIAEKPKMFEGRFPIRSCESSGKPQFMRLALSRMQSVRELISGLRASKELMAMIAAEQEN